MLVWTELAVPRGERVIALRAAAFLAAAATLAGCVAVKPPQRAPEPSESREVAPRATATAAPRSEWEACDARLRCYAIETAPTVLPAWPTPDPFAARVLHFTTDELMRAIDAADWPMSERGDFASMIVGCENRAMDAGIVNNETPSGAYGAAQLWLGWFDHVGIPRERWYVLTDNIRAAKGARDYSVAHGMSWRAQWSCTP